MRDSTYAAIGLRLSDNGADQSEIVEVAVVRCSPDAVERPWVSLVRPTWISDRRSEQLAGIRAEELLGAPSFTQVAERLRAELSEAVPIGHNATVILDQLRRAGAAFSRPPIDTLAIAQVLDPAAPSHELDDLCAAYGIVSEHAHGALADAELSRKLLLALRERWGQLSIDVQAKLIAISRARGLGSQLRPFIAAMPGVEDVPPLRRPVEPRGRAPAADDAAREEEQPELVKLTGESLAGLTAAVFSGAAGNAGSGMERRDQQLAMAENMAHVLRGGGLGLIEAGTGVGKSLAYLTPAAIWAVATGQRVMIATHTKNLQSQLLDSDVARLRGMLEQSLPEEVAGALEATVLRGRSNYLCRRNVDRALDAQLDAAGDDDELSELLLARVVVWAEVTSTGDREELRLPESDDREWARLSASGVSCLSDGCPYVEDGACFLDGAYKRAERSHLIIGNQWLLIWSLLVDQSRVPHAHAVIIDEAHFLEDVATGIFGDEVSQRGLQSAVNRVAPEHPKRTKTLVQRAQRHGLGQRGSLVAQARRTRESIAGVWAQLELFYAEIQGEREGEPALRLTGQLREEQGWRHVQRRWETSKAQIERLTDELGELDGAAREGARNATGDQWSKLRALADDASRVTRSLASSAESVEKVLAANPEFTVSWLEFAEGRAGGPELTLKAAPLNVGPELRDRLWSRRDERHAIVLTGATLTVDERWDFLRRRLGLAPPAAREAQHGSPFDYERHARIFVARDMPQPPATEPPDEYEAALAEAIPRLAAAADGRTLVLFTSYATMNHVADQVGEAIAGQGLELKVQRRDGSAADVANALKSAPRTVVFGVSSLWTGVDIPGEHLSLLIICRMPFDHPDNPVHAARGEQYMNAFGALTLPVAILQLRQGFGRLIRSRSDRGVCVILDPRPGTKSYGGVVRRSLPRKLERASVEKIVEEVGAFLAPDPADERRRATIGGR